MGERKPSCHYIPPDFDPSKAPRRCKPQNGQHQVRFMLPMSVECEACGDYMFQGTKCNCRKELCYNEFYLGINVYRIYLHCKSCYAEITIKTDPKNCDYILEKGASRRSEPWREHEVARAIEMKEKMSGKVVERVEEKAVDTKLDMNQKREIARLSAVSAKQERVDVEDALKKRGDDSILTNADRQKLEKFEEDGKGKRKEGGVINTGDVQVEAPKIAGTQWEKSEKRSNGLLSYDTSDDGDE